MPEQYTVLVVDDDHEIVTAATLRLRAAGYRTLTACDGDSGVALAAECHPDIILLDVRMPRKDGLTALGELKQRGDTKDIPVVMLSASIVDQQSALDAGARFFLKKPYRGDTLVQTVTIALESPSVIHSDLLHLPCTSIGDASDAQLLPLANNPQWLSQELAEPDAVHRTLALIVDSC